MSLVDAKQLNRFWKDEVPTGAIDDSNVSFALSLAPVENDAVELYLDGLYLTPGIEYSISGVNITMTAAPKIGQVLRASYIQKTGGA